MKKFIIKYVLLLVYFSVLGFIYNHVKPMIIANSAMLQLQDSDVAYVQFKGVQNAFKFYWLLYVLPLAVIVVKDVKKFTKKKESKGEF